MNYNNLITFNNKKCHRILINQLILRNNKGLFPGVATIQAVIDANVSNPLATFQVYPISTYYFHH